jgi:2-keto-4-pentenoate hydratase
VTDARVVAGLGKQLERWRAALRDGAGRVGWKIGLNDPAVQERLGITEPVIGNLTSHTEVPDGGAVSLQGMARPTAEVEVAIELRRSVAAGAEPDTALAAIESLGPAIEIVDPAPPFDDLEAILAGNVVHRAVAFGPTRQDVALSNVVARAVVDGQPRGEAPATVDLAGTIRLVADLLGSQGERLHTGDRIIAGALVAVGPLEPESDLSADLGELGSVGLRLTAA